MEFNHNASTITSALGVDALEVLEAMMVYAKGMMECGTESKVAELFYKKAINNEKFMGILVFLAMQGVSHLVKASVEDMIKEITPEERKALIKEVMGK